MSRSGRLEWVRIDTNIDEHPQIIAAGFEGSTVFQLCIRVSGAFGLGGRLNGFYRSPVFLARRLGTTPHFVEVGIAKCLEVELLINDGDELVIPTIARFNGSDTVRKQEYRANKNNTLPANVPDCPGQSRTVPVMSQVVPYDTNGTVRNGTNKTNKVSKTTSSHPGKPGKADDVAEVFNHWKSVMRKDRSKCPDKRKAVIVRALQSYSVEDCKAAIDGCAKTPFNMGDNDRHQPYNDIELILRDAAHIDRFMEAATTRPASTTPAASPEPIREQKPRRESEVERVTREMATRNLPPKGEIRTLPDGRTVVCPPRPPRIGVH